MNNLLSPRLESPGAPSLAVEAELTVALSLSDRLALRIGLALLLWSTRHQRDYSSEAIAARRENARLLEERERRFLLEAGLRLSPR